MSTYRHARRGTGTKVHAVSRGGQVCGSGRNTIGTRRNSGLRYTEDAVTCKKCLVTITRKQTRNQ